MKKKEEFTKYKEGIRSLGVKARTDRKKLQTIDNNSRPKLFFLNRLNRYGTAKKNDKRIITFSCLFHCVKGLSKYSVRNRLTFSPTCMIDRMKVFCVWLKSYSYSRLNIDLFHSNYYINLIRFTAS